MPFLFSQLVILMGVPCGVGAETANTKKQLVFIAGPHQSEAEAVGKFFLNHAVRGDSTGSVAVSLRGATTSSGNVTGLDGWIWPQVDEDLPGEDHEMFENLFWNADNETMQEILLESIETAWQIADSGIVIGANGFDATRGDPHSSGLKAMTSIVDTLNVDAHQVHVVFVYRNPRVEQWASLFHFHNEGSSDTYQEFVCRSDNTAHMANMPMNPFMLASVYRDQGYKVSVIDSTGVQNSALDTAHVVACKVLSGTKCSDGWVTNLNDITYSTDNQEKGLSSDALGISTDDWSALETMFRDRDCYYRQNLKSDGGFAVIHQHSVWNDCTTSETDLARYELLATQCNLVDAIKSQMNCSDFDTDSNIYVHKLHDESTEKKVFAIVVLVTLICYFVFDQIGRYKRRQTHYVKSPKTGRTVWMDFAEKPSPESVKNLHDIADEDDKFSDVDLHSPKLRILSPTSFFRSPTGTSPQNSGGSKSNNSSPTNLSGATPKNGSNSFRVGLFQKTPIFNHSRRPRDNNNSLDLSIQNLERELS